VSDAVAAHWGSWAKRTPYGFFPSPAPSRGSTAPVDGGTGGPIGLTVELYLGALGWTDISTYVYYRDRIRISRGRPNEASRIQPQTCSMTLNNADGRFSPRNPVGPWYGYIGRNTPIRVSRMQNGVRRYRFVGEVPAWPVTWDISGRDVYVPIQAAGMLRRLQQGTQALNSTMRRSIPLLSTLIAYWPCEDGAQSSQLASGAGGPAMSILGTPSLDSSSVFVGSSAIPTLQNDTWSGRVPQYTDSGSASLQFLMAIPASSTVTDGTRIVAIATSGAVSRVELIWRTGGQLQLKAFSALGTTLADSGSVLLNSTVNGQLLQVTVGWQPQAGGTRFWYSILAVGSTNIYLNFTDAASPNTITAMNYVTMAPDGNMSGIVIGQIYAQNILVNLNTLNAQLNAYNAEVPATRFTRICGEQGLNAALVSSGEVGTDGVSMGYQLPDSLANILQQVPDADLGLFYEARDQLALAYRTRLSLYNQGTTYNNSRPGLTLDYALHELSGALNPLDDDAYTRNDVTAQRISGSSVQAADGSPLDRLSTVNVGDYSTTYSLSIGSDAILPDAAHWRLHLGTTDEPRYPTIPLNLRHPTFTGNVGLLNQALTVDIGDLVVINNPPSGRGAPDTIRLILQGYSETLGIFEHDMVLNCSPEAPYRVGMFDDLVLGRYDTDGSTLAAPMGAALNANPFFAGGSLAEWSAVAGTATVLGTSGSSTPLPAGGPTGYGVLLTPDGSLNNCALEGASTSGFYVAASLSATYQVSALVYSPGGYANVEIGFDWYDVNQGYLSTTSVVSSVAAGTWTALATSAAPPASTAFLRPRIGEKSSPTAANTLYIAAGMAWQGGMSVASTNTLLPAWTTSAGAFPFDIACGGERMTVTGITGASSPQAFTVARGVNGITKSQVAGTDVRLWQPTIVSL